MVRVIFSLAILVGCLNLCADDYQVVNDGPVHEAFVVKESGSLILEPVPYAPPPKITELVPKQNDRDAIWIPGYWSWACQHGVFVWTSGVWRRPPPQRQWVAGYWKNYPQGWVWIGGFWSNIPLEKITYLPTPPPDPIDQRVPTPPAAAENYFWVPGNWQFDTTLKQYVWHAGRWDILDPHWVYCPSHYVWRESGYVFIPGFWDWPMRVRGEAFAAIYIDPKAVESFVYTQGKPLDPLYVLEQVFPYWPDYSSLFHYHYFFHYDVWSAWGAAPPWWNWGAWSALPRSAQWALWWWWTHPRYPHPTWLTPELAQSIKPAPPFVLEMMGKVVPPLFVTSKGIVGEMTLFKALHQTTGHNLPVFPLELKQIQKIQNLTNPPPANGQGTKEKPLVPNGTANSSSMSPEKPFFGPQPQDLKSPPRRAILPPRPIFVDDESEAPAPPKANPKKVTPQRAPSPYTNQYMQPTPRSTPSAFQNPRQGYEIQYEYPQTPMQSKHLNRIMGRPQPQINPSGPNVNPVPGDYSTLPGQ